MSQTTTEKKPYQAQYDDKVNGLENYRTEEEQRLRQQQANTREAANISYQKLLKYLPQQTAGYSVGMTETAKIAANNSLQRQLAEADANFENSKTELNRYIDAEKDAAADKLYERERADEQWQLQQDQWNYQKEQDASAKTAAEQDFVFNSAVSAIEGMEFDTVDALQNYVTGLQGKVSEEQYKVLENKMNYYREGVAGVEEENRRKAADKNQLIESDLYIDAFDDLAEDGENVVIAVNGESDIDVESAGAVSDEALIKRLNTVITTPKNGRVYYFDGQYFTYHNGTYYELYEGDGLGVALDNYRLHGKSVRNYENPDAQNQ